MLAEWDALHGYQNRPFNETLSMRIEVLDRLIAAVRVEVARPSQLPPGMEDCTIQFKECPRGHGRLTAANWTDNGCYVCALESAQLEARKLREELDG